MLCKVLQPQLLDLPVGARFLSAQNQNQALILWFEVDPEAMLVPRAFQVLWTGSSIVPEGATYLATVQIELFVWHLYELTPPESDGA